VSGGPACECVSRIGREAASADWFVVHKRTNHSAFNGYRPTPSLYSEIACCICGRHSSGGASWIARRRWLGEGVTGGTVARGSGFFGLASDLALDYKILYAA
jgi:hypothetical protein